MGEIVRGRSGDPRQALLGRILVGIGADLDAPAGGLGDRRRGLGVLAHPQVGNVDRSGETPEGMFTATARQGTSTAPSAMANILVDVRPLIIDPQGANGLVKI